VMPNPALEPTAASELRRLAVSSALCASEAAQRERWTSKGRAVRVTTALVAFTALLTSPLASPQSVLERAQRDEVFGSPDFDPQMEAAFRKARETLDGFLAIAKSPPPTVSSVSVKIGISERGKTEYLWITPFKATAAEFVGRVSNTPRWVRSVSRGQEIRFRREEIVDWMYIDTAERRMYGSYTTCALLKREPPADAEQYRQRVGLKCDV